MTISIAHLGPAGTNAETAALAYARWLEQSHQKLSILCAYPSIAQTLKVTASGETGLAIVPVENSIEGSVAITLDTLWQLDRLHIQQALVLPITHALISCAPALASIKTVYSHPQALAQCQGWLEQFLPSAQLIATNSTTEALQHLPNEKTAGAIASQRAAEIYQLPILAYPINDRPDNCTKFWVVSLEPSHSGMYTSLAFSVPANVPGALVKPLQALAKRGINLSRIESRPAKKALGDYLFFFDLEADSQNPSTQEALEELKGYTQILKIFGSYDLVSI
jgi:prephenate dehydratase